VNRASTDVLLWMAQMVGVYRAMPDAEREELERWERENVDGSAIGSSDWPGWEKYIGRCP